MLPDSTVGDLKKPRKKRPSGDDMETVITKKTKKKVSSKKKLIKKKSAKKAHSAVDDDDYGSDMDLSKELYPMSHYIKDRTELVHQMFSSLSKHKLKSMLPDNLKKHSLAEMQELCCAQIEIMSRKRIAGLIKGCRADEISSSEAEEVSSGEEPEGDAVTVVDETEREPPDSTGVEVVLPNIDDELQRVKPHTFAVAMGAKIKPINKQKLELLELEMRARAIKKMLASQQTEEEEEAVECVSVTPPLVEIADGKQIEVIDDVTQRSVVTVTKKTKQSSPPDLDIIPIDVIMVDDKQPVVVTIDERKATSPHKTSETDKPPAEQVKVDLCSDDAGSTDGELSDQKSECDSEQACNSVDMATDKPSDVVSESDPKPREEPSPVAAEPPAACEQTQLESENNKLQTEVPEQKSDVNEEEVDEAGPTDWSQIPMDWSQVANWNAMSVAPPKKQSKKSKTDGSKRNNTTDGAAVNSVTEKSQEEEIAGPSTKDQPALQPNSEADIEPKPTKKPKKRKLKPKIQKSESDIEEGELSSDDEYETDNDDGTEEHVADVTGSDKPEVAAVDQLTAPEMEIINQQEPLIVSAGTEHVPVSTHSVDERVESSEENKDSAVTATVRIEDEAKTQTVVQAVDMCQEKDAVNTEVSEQVTHVSEDKEHVVEELVEESNQEQITTSIQQPQKSGERTPELATDETADNSCIQSQSANVPESSSQSDVSVVDDIISQPACTDAQAVPDSQHADSPGPDMQAAPYKPDTTVTSERDGESESAQREVETTTLEAGVQTAIKEDKSTLKIVEDIFASSVQETVTEPAADDSSKSDTLSTASKSGFPIPPAVISVSNEDLYDDIPDVGTKLEQPHKPEDENPETTNEDSEHSNQKKGLNWDVNLQVDETELVLDDESDTEAPGVSAMHMPTDELKLDGKTVSTPDRIEEMLGRKRAVTPEITAQRYRSRLMDSIRLSPTIPSDEKKSDKFEPKTKVYCGASTTAGKGGKPEKKVKSKASSSSKKGSKKISKVEKKKTVKKSKERKGNSQSEKKVKKNKDETKIQSSKETETESVSKAKEKTVIGPTWKEGDTSTKAGTSSSKSRKSKSPVKDSSKSKSAPKKKRKESRSKSPDRKTYSKAKGKSADKSARSVDRARSTSRRRTKSGSNSSHARSRSREHKKRTRSRTRSRSRTRKQRSISGGKSYGRHKDSRHSNTKSRSRSRSQVSRGRDRSRSLTKQHYADKSHDDHSSSQLPNQDGHSTQPNFDLRKYIGANDKTDINKHSSHDDREYPWQDEDVDPKRFRAEWEPRCKIITQPSKPVVRTYELVPTGNRRKVTGTKSRPITIGGEGRSRSPISFPSPGSSDIEVLTSEQLAAKKSVHSSEPELVVLSD